MPSKNTGIIILVLCLLASLGACLGVYFTNVACGWGLGTWVGSDCPKDEDVISTLAPAPATLTPLQTLQASGQAIQVAPLEIGTPTSKIPLSNPPTGYATQTTPSYTMTFDIQVDGAHNYWRNIMAHDDASRGPAVFIWPSDNLDWGNHIQIYQTPNGANTVNGKDPLVTDGTTWTTITWTVNNGTLQLYTNGIADNSVTLTAPYAWPTPDPTWFWRDTSRASQSPRSIMVRNVYFWPSALTSTQIALLAPPASTEPNPCAGYTSTTLASTVTAACLQKTWKDTGCKTTGTTYPSDTYTGWWKQSPNGTNPVGCDATHSGTQCGAGNFGRIQQDMVYWSGDPGRNAGCRG